jgi:hypothetical protein
MPDETNSNGRTLSRLDERTEYIQKAVDEIKTMFTALDTRVRGSENEIALIKGRWSVLVIVVSAIISLAISLYLK